jgi:predicted Zn-dependent peptidase
MVINLKNETDLSGFYIVFRGSTNLEKKGTYGIAHLSEHIYCKAIEDLQDELQQYKIEWNAYTSSNEVVFYFTGLEEFLCKYRDVIVEKMMSFVPTAEMLQKEKLIVIEEYLDSFTDQFQSFRSNLTRRTDGDYSPIGLKEDIENITYDDFMAFYNMQYGNPDMIVSVSKTFVYVNDTIQFTDRAKLNKTIWEAELSAPLEGSTFPESDKVSIVYTQEVDVKDAALMRILCTALGSGLNSPLYQEIREKRGLAYFVYAFLSNTGNKYTLEISTSTTKGNESKVEEALLEVFNNPTKHITSERLNTIKESAYIDGKIKKINQHRNIGDYLDPLNAEVKQLYPMVSLEDLHGLAEKYMKLDKFIFHSENTLYV